jgi:hypothetical protein
VDGTGGSDARRTSLALLIGVLGLSGCGSGKHEGACTLMGCSSGVVIEIKQLPKELPRARKIDVCVAGQCTHDTVYETGKAEGKYVPKAFLTVFGKASELHGLGPHPVSVAAYDRQGTVLLRVSDSVVMEKYSPNGVGCSPTCFVAGLRLNVGKHMLEPLPRRVAAR